MTKLSYLSFNKVDISAAVPFIIAQMLGGFAANFVTQYQLSPPITEKLA